MAYARPIKFVFEYDESVDKAMAENQKIALFRILQEQLNNVAKYAKATTVHILLFKHEHTASLSVVDDGSGFDLSATKKGLGLVNIRNRAELLGGKAEIHSSPGKGCTLKVSIPLPVHNLN
jgi:signal transduction histidine kinase